MRPQLLIGLGLPVVVGVHRSDATQEIETIFQLGVLILLLRHVGRAATFLFVFAIVLLILALEVAPQIGFSLRVLGRLFQSSGSSSSTTTSGSMPFAWIERPDGV